MRATFKRPAPGRVIAGLFMVSVAVLTVVACPKPAGSPNRFAALLDPRIGGRLYSATSPFNQVIPANPQLDPRSAAYVKLLNRSKQEKGFVMALSEWSVPAYFARADTPRHNVWIEGFDDVPRVMRDVPIPEDARPDPADDGHLTVVDPATNCEYDLITAVKVADGWTAKWANVTSTADNGVYPFSMSTRASGFAPLAGMIWPAELRKGRIDHALVFAYPYTRSGGPVSPATSSDGRTALADALPEGARVQLDPALDLTRLGLTAHELTIAKAMQQYGMFLGDTGGALAIYAVNPQSFATNPYQGLLPIEPSILLNKIPVNRFRVLNTGKQMAQTRYSIVPNNCARIEVVS